MHLLLFPSWYPSSPDDVNGVFFRDQALELASSGFQVGVIAIKVHPLKNLSFKRSFFKITKELDEGIQTVRIETYNWVPRFPLFIITLWRILGEIGYKIYLKKSSSQPNLLHAHSSIFGGVAAKHIKEKYGLPYVVTEHKSSFFYKHYSKKLLDYAHEVFVSSEANIAVGEVFLKEMVNLFPKSESKWRYIPNVLPKRFEQVVPKQKCQSQRFILGTLSSLVESKGILTIIKAMPFIKEVFPHVHLKIGGEGPYKEVLQSNVASLGLQDSVSFEGKINPEATTEFFSNIGIYVLPSHYETFGIVLIEALSTGVPVVATDCGGPSSIIKNDRLGSLVPVDDVLKLSQAIIDMIRNYHSIDPEYLRNYSLENFCSQKIIAKLNCLYVSIGKG